MRDAACPLSTRGGGGGRTPVLHVLLHDRRAPPSCRRGDGDTRRYGEDKTTRTSPLLLIVLDIVPQPVEARRGEGISRTQEADKGFCAASRSRQGVLCSLKKQTRGFVQPQEADKGFCKASRSRQGVLCSRPPAACWRIAGRSSKQRTPRPREPCPGLTTHTLRLPAPPRRVRLVRGEGRGVST